MHISYKEHISDKLRKILIQIKLSNIWLGNSGHGDWSPFYLDGSPIIDDKVEFLCPDKRCYSLWDVKEKEETYLFFFKKLKYYCAFVGRIFFDKTDMFECVPTVIEVCNKKYYNDLFKLAQFIEKSGWNTDINLSVTNSGTDGIAEYINYNALSS